MAEPRRWQLHRPQVGEWVAMRNGGPVRIDAVHHETRREVFRVTYLDREAPQGRRGCQIMRDGRGWMEFDLEEYQTQHGEQVLPWQ